MKSLLVAFLIAGILSVQGYAECMYFRVSYKLLTCGVADTKALDASNPYQSSSDVPELAEPNGQVLVQIHCECEYSLQGSDPRCDMDETMGRSSIMGADDPDHSCRRGQSLCRDVCPARLP